MNDLEAKTRCAALENIVIELTLITLGDGQINPRHKARLERLLGDLQWCQENLPNQPASAEQGE